MGLFDKKLSIKSTSFGTWLADEDISFNSYLLAKKINHQQVIDTIFVIDTSMKWVIEKRLINHSGDLDLFVPTVASLYPVGEFLRY